MTDIDKFYSDADRLASRIPSTDTSAGPKFASDLTRLFLSWTHDYGEIGEDLASWWANKYRDGLGEDGARRKAVEWFGAALSLLSGCFTDKMDFPDDDWEEIRDTISASADELDIDLIQTIMTVIVERGHA